MTACEPLPVGAVHGDIHGPAIHFKAVDLDLGRTRILEQVSFQVAAGSIHALVGPNGGGKSSLIKTLLGQMPHRGDLSLHWPASPGTIGYVPQAMVGMQGKRKRRMGALSGGERQRVLLAQGLVPEAQLLVLDEPMSALDEPGVQVFEQLLADWRRAGTTVLWVEHDLQAVSRLADRVTGLNRSVQFDGDPQQLLDPECVLKLFSSHPAHAVEAQR